MEQYDKIAKEYYARRKDKTRFDFNRDMEVPAMINLLGDVRRKKILDIGCGFGDHLMQLSKKQPKKLVGFDKSAELIKYAKKLNLSNVEFYIGDMNKKLQYKKRAFDIVFSSLVIHYVPKEKLHKFFSEVNRILKTNGKFIFSTAHPIFNLRKQRASEILASGKDELRIDLDYFDESAHSRKWSLAQIKTYRLTFETLIKTALNSGFQIVDYVETKPVESAKKYKKAELLFKMPSFIIFKLRKVRNLN
jgi:SAM-dependent methyltransferase